MNWILSRRYKDTISKLKDPGYGAQNFLFSIQVGRAARGVGLWSYPAQGIEGLVSGTIPSETDISQSGPQQLYTGELPVTWLPPEGNRRI